MKNAVPQTTCQQTYGNEDEIDSLSVFLQEYSHYSRNKSDPENDFVQEIRIGIKKLYRILEGLKLPEKKNFMSDWITSDQIILKLGIAERTLAGWRKSGKLPFARIENKIYYKKQDLEELMIKRYKWNKDHPGKP